MLRYGHHWVTYFNPVKNFSAYVDYFCTAYRKDKWYMER